MDAQAELASIFKKAWSDSGLKQADYAKSIKVAASYFSNIVNENQLPSENVLRKLEQHGKVPRSVTMPLWMKARGYIEEDPATSKGKPPARSVGRDEGYVPLVHGASCGKFVEAMQDPRRAHGEQRKTFWPEGAEIKGSWVVTAEGSSMTGSGIEEGDQLLIDPNPKKLIEGCVALVRLDDEFTVKRWFVKGDSIILRPTNPDKRKYVDLPIAKADFAERNGQAWRVWRVRSVRDPMDVMENE